MTDKKETCVTCGHLKSQHIYEEGACRPGFVCACDKFVADKPASSAKYYYFHESDKIHPDDVLDGMSGIVHVIEASHAIPLDDVRLLVRALEYVVLETDYDDDPLNEVAHKALSSILQKYPQLGEK